MKAIFSSIDTHPANSLALTLKSIGYECFMLTDDAIKKLRNKGYIGGVGKDTLDYMGYSGANMPYVGIEALDDADLFIDIKSKWLDSFKPLYPNLKCVHYLINGGIDDYQNCGFEYPVITSNMWVEGEAFKEWLPFDNIHNLKPRAKREKFESPITLIHNVRGWGMSYLVDPLLELGIKMYGISSPNGMLKNKDLGGVLESALCNVHLKSNDCPGWALVETMASGVPLVVPELMLDRMRMRPIYEDGITCLTWGKDSYDIKATQETGITKEWFQQDKDKLVNEIQNCIEKLSNPEYNYEIGMAGFERMTQLLEWTEDKRDRLIQFFKKNNLPV